MFDQNVSTIKLKLAVIPHLIPHFSVLVVSIPAYDRVRISAIPTVRASSLCHIRPSRARQSFSQRHTWRGRIDSEIVVAHRYESLIDQSLSVLVAERAVGSLEIHDSIRREGPDRYIVTNEKPVECALDPDRVCHRHALRNQHPQPRAWIDDGQSAFGPIDAGRVGADLLEGARSGASPRIDVRPPGTTRQQFRLRCGTVIRDSMAACLVPREGKSTDFVVIVIVLAFTEEFVLRFG